MHHTSILVYQIAMLTFTFFAVSVTTVEAGHEQKTLPQALLLLLVSLVIVVMDCCDARYCLSSSSSSYFSSSSSSLYALNCLPSTNTHCLP